MRFMKQSRTPFAVVALCGVLLLCGTTAFAVIVPMLDVGRMEKNAHVITVGEVTATREVGRGVYNLRGQDVPARVMEATLRAERVLKGQAAAEYTVRYYDPQALIGYDYVHEGRYGVFFLRRKGDSYAFVSPFHVSLFATRGSCESAGAPLSRVAAEMGCVLRAEDDRKRPRVAAIEALSTIKNRAGTSMLRAAAREQPEPLNYLAADRLLTRGDLSQLPLAERALRKSFDIRIEEEGFSMSTGWSIEEISDRRAIPTLARLLSAPDVRTRQAALRALGQTKDDAAIPPLLAGFEDGDAGVRWYAVMGMAELAGEDDEGGAWYPTFETFQADESLYVTHWKAWAAGRPVSPAPENK